MSAENNSIKHRKIDGSDSKDAYCLIYLPKEALIHVSTFLAAPSRALFAVSLEGSLGSSDENILSSIFPSSQLIGSGGSVNIQVLSAQLAQSHVQKILWEMEDLNQTDILDFGKIKEEYVVQLSDDGIKTILLCVDAVTHVKRLKLANCINITGVGLEPLRGSTIIEQIDLSLAGDGFTGCLHEPPISCNAVLPILDSIISQDGCSLKHLQFPYKWRRHGRRAEERQRIDAFDTRYNQMLRSRVDVCCLECNENLPREEEWARINYTCYECLNAYCLECGDEHAIGCQLCGRYYCRQCEVKVNRCDDCTYEFCVSCVEVYRCSTCGEASCLECATCICCECCTAFCNDCKPDFCRECEGDRECEGERCYNHFCGECNEQIGANAVKVCEDCDTHYCGSCRVRSCQKQEKEEQEEVCTGCIKLAHPFLIEENKNLRRKVAELTSRRLG